MLPNGDPVGMDTYGEERRGSVVERRGRVVVSTSAWHAAG